MNHERLTLDARLARGALFVAALVVVAHVALTPLAEMDLFFHLKIGELILRDGAIPFRNLFSFTFPDAPDPDLCWGFQVIVALLHRAGGFGAIVALKAALVTTAAALVQLACRRGGAGPVASALAVIAAVLAADQRIVERPHLITFVGVGAVGLVLVELERAPSRARWLWLFPVGVVVWANLHAGVFLGPLVLLLHGVGSLLDRRPVPRALWIVVALSSLATFATPAGARLPGYLLWHTGLGATRIIEEFRRADPWNDPWFFALALGCALTLAASLRTWRRALPLLVVGLLGYRSVRFAAEFAWLAAPVAAVGLERAGRAMFAISLAARAQLLLALALVVGVATLRRGRPSPYRIAPDAAPFAAIDFVTREGLRDRLYVDLDVGCYLLWEGWPRYRVFQDARLPAYPDSFHRALDETPLWPAAFDALLRPYGVDAALLAEPGVNMRAGSFDPDEWALVWRARDALVFVRREPRHAALITAREIPLRPRFTFLEGTRYEPIAAPPARSPVAVCEWGRRLSATLAADGDIERAVDAAPIALDCLPVAEEVWARFHLAARWQRTGQLARALDGYDRVLALDPGHVGALTNRGFARLAGDRGGARDDFRRALQLAPDSRLASEGLRRADP